MIWPPKSRTHMVAWQTEHGSDPSIAKIVGISSDHVRNQRVKWKVDAYQPTRDEIRTFLTDEEINELYGGLRYD